MTNFNGSSHELTWAQGLPEKELYDIYHSTLLARFPAFSVRDYGDARFDMAQPFHEYDNSDVISQTILDFVVTPESHERFANDLLDFISLHGLQKWIDDGNSVAFGTDHGQFTDVPVTAETLGRIGFVQRDKLVQSVSEMITVMELEIDPEEGVKPVIDTLSHISGVAVTVPRLDGTPSEEVENYRVTKNKSGLIVLRNIRDMKGSVSVLSVIGRHNHTSKRGHTHYIHEPNRQTLEAYKSERVKFIPIYIHCPTFTEDGGMTPAEMQYELFPPMEITDPTRDTKKIVRMYRDATERTVGEEFRHGIKIKKWKGQQVKRNAQALLERIKHDDTSTRSTSEY